MNIQQQVQLDFTLYSFCNWCFVHFPYDIFFSLHQKRIDERENITTPIIIIFCCVSKHGVILWNGSLLVFFVHFFSEICFYGISKVNNQRTNFFWPTTKFALLVIWKHKPTRTGKSMKEVKVFFAFDAVQLEILTIKTTVSLFVKIEELSNSLVVFPNIWKTEKI